MKKSRTVSIIKSIIKDGPMTRQDIARLLHISMPTALALVNELVEQDILLEVGALESTGGRKAKCLTVNAEYAYSIGLDVRIRHIKLALVDYAGAIVAVKKEPLAFRDDPAWYDQVNQAIGNMLDECHVAASKVICAGISFPGIIDESTDMILHSHILNIQNLSLDRFRNMLSVPLLVENDANCGGFNELYSYTSSYIFLSLNESVGGALVMDGKIQVGDSYHAGEIGHTILVPHGKRCYCGKKGCADAYLSPLVLRKNGESLQEFMKRVEDGDKDAGKAWDGYLDHLAILASNLRLLINCDIIIGGEIAEIIDPYLDLLKGKMQELDIFARNIGYIHVAKHLAYSQVTGAARLSLDRYAERALDE